MSTGIKTLQSGIQDRLKGYLSRAASIQGYLARVTYPKYQKAQLDRWRTEGASEEARWAALDPVYARAKRKRFAGYPGGGRKMLIATRRLQPSVTGPHGEHRAKFERTGMTIATTVPYAAYVDEVRTFSEFRPEELAEWSQGVMDYIRGGQ